ncbi:hypothetical protein EDD15DRAFT_2375241 [Pisolithus albus]|nr:hypothetical protein EDD15DRAFT_2375241 [Pisolithus albus]
MAVGTSRAQTNRRAKLSTSRVHHVIVSRKFSGRVARSVNEILGPKKIEARATEAQERQRARLEAMTPQERRALEAMHEGQENFFHAETDNAYDITSVLDGSKVIDLSHGGGELRDLARDLFKDVKNIENKGLRKCRVDYRTRRDRAQRRTDAFAREMPELVRAYLEWSARSNGAEKRTLHVRTDSDSSISSALVRQGVVPCAPLRPHTAIMMDALELYRVARNRCPHFSIQAFVKTVSDLQGVQYRPYLARLFSIALDVYLQIRLAVNDLVLKALRRDTPDWRLKNACPACTYTLEDEPNLKFKLLFAMDGNDSLKHISRAAIGGYESTAKDVGERFLGDDRYLSRAFVDQFGVGRSDESLMEPTADDDNPCAGRWKNMKEDVTSRMWGIFDEAGVFMAICRHGFSLVVADIVRSGEQAKYPLAAVSKLLDVFGDSLAGGYDIGCKFGTTLNRSTVGPRARALNYTSLLRYLARYVDGIGLEDLEGCERLFSKTNGLASAVHYASAFHRRQAIAGYIAHNDEHEVYLNLTTMLLNNYRQALRIIQEGKNTLPRLMDDLGITDVSVFSAWLLEENEYLAARLHEPKEETLQMEYWQKLVNLDASQKHLGDLAWAVATPSSAGTSSFVQKDIAATMRKETMRHHATENFEKDLKMVQDLEGKLGITKRWVPEDEEWQTAGCLVANRKYQRCLDQLESLVVARIFELSKMNQAGTGYKLRKHIAKALKARSAAIRSALDRFNVAARACSPPPRQLTFEEVVEYTFLTDFDLLRNATREDISQRPWASPAARAAMDHYFKVCRAEEEIERLNVEVRRIVTYLRDEDRYMKACIAQLQIDHPPLAYQAQHYYNVRARFTSHHLRLLAEISGLHGFTGIILPGKSTKTNPGDSAGEPATVIPSAVSITTVPTLLLAASDSDDDNSDLDEFDADEDEDGDDGSTLTLQEIIRISSDGYGAEEQH